MSRIESTSRGGRFSGRRPSKPNLQPPPDQSTPLPTSPFTNRRIHFIGIGGCGMSGLARMLKQRGARCNGSDSTPSDLTDALTAAGINVNFDQIAGAIPDDVDLVIASAAIKPDHPEMLAAQARGLEILTYAEALGKAQLDRTAICIAGTHGKSTTTAMLAHVLIETGLDPSFIVGATCPQIGGGSRTGSATIPPGSFTSVDDVSTFKGAPGLLICEACEFNRSFHHHRPTLAAILNLEEDHLDIYGDLAGVVQAFKEFAELVPPEQDNGYLLIAHDGAHRRDVTASVKSKIETFGFNPAADWHVAFNQQSREVKLSAPRAHASAPIPPPSEGGGKGVGGAHVKRMHAERPTGPDMRALLATWTLHMTGEHNALNSAAAAILAHQVGAPWQGIADALSSFHGIERRMQRLGVRKLRSWNGETSGGDVVVYDDYGHHPTEVETTLRALRAAENPKRLICVFQPHQHSRTRFLLDQFAQSFSSADVVIVPHIYFVRDSEIEKTKVSAADLVDRLRGRGITAMHLYPFEAIVEQLEVMCRDGDLVVIMGAGPVWKVAKAFLK
jgi:UDP-N-acetylmuramate--alanine ligase